jgi:hypothetical protein
MNAKKILAVWMLLSLAPGAQAASCDEDQGKAPQVAQKLDLLARLLDDSKPLRRAQAAGDAEVLEKIEEARKTLADARAALDSGCVAEASSLSSSGLKTATTAFRKSPVKNTMQLRNTYEEALQLSTSFLLSLGAQPEQHHELSDDDLIGIERQIERAETLASGGNYAEAVRLLAPVNDRLQRRLAVILSNKTIYYEKEFATAGDEYAYYREQYEGYLMLLKTAKKEPPYSARNRIDSLLGSASGLYDAAETDAATESWDDAIYKMQEAVGHVEQAVSASGFTY